MKTIIIEENKYFLLPIAVLLIFSFLGCTSTPKSIYKINETASGENIFSAPTNSTLLFGFISKENTGLRSKNLPVYKIEFVQINPNMPPMFITPGNDKKDRAMIYTSPVPVGSVFKIASWDDKIGRIDYGISKDENLLGGLAGFSDLYGRIYPSFSQSIIINASNPGLCYYGSYILDKDRENFTVDTKKTELDALKLLLKNYKKTPWENIITERIKELKKWKLKLFL